MIRYRFTPTTRDELDAFIELVGSDSTITASSIVRIGTRFWRFGELAVAADCIPVDRVRFLL